MELRCPTCRTPWRHVALCGRCGTDLSMVMQVAVKAWELREKARQLLCTGGHSAEAVEAARAACQLQAVPQAQKLLALALVANQQTAEAYKVMSQLVSDHSIIGEGGL